MSRKKQNPIARFNDCLAEKITNAVGSMWCAYLFTALSCISLPSTLATRDVKQYVAWFTQTFLQLVLLSIIQKGQNLSGQSSDRQAKETHRIVKQSHDLIMQEVKTIQEAQKSEAVERRELAKILKELKTH